MIVVLVVAAGAAWEGAALRVLAADADVVVLKRCVDVDDLLATAASGQADVAVLGLDAPGLDPVAVEHLRRHGVQPLVVLDGAVDDGARLRAARVGIRALVPADALVDLPAAVARAAEVGEDEEPAPSTTTAGPTGLPDAAATGPVPGGGRGPGRVLVVWGPPGAPGRSTVAAGLAAELARRGRGTVLVDADPVAASQAQQLGVLDEVSGLLSAARHAAAGTLEDELASVQRGLGEHLAVVTGLPRPDRWREVRPGAVETLLRALRTRGEVVVDTGPSLEQDASADVGLRPGRQQCTLEALATADEVIVVGAADPVGLARLSRGLVEVREAAPGTALRVVVNRMRPGLGFSERDVAGVVEGFGRVSSLHFLPLDQASVDRALAAGRSVGELAADGPLGRGLAAVVEDLAPSSLTQVEARERGARTVGGARAAVPAGRGRRGLSRRRAARAHRR